MVDITLPILLQNDITTYANYSMALSILNAYENYEKRIITKFINIYSMKNDHAYWLDFLEDDGFLGNDLFSIEYINYSKSVKIENIFEFIRENLQSQKYLIIHVNGFYLSGCYSAYKTEDPVAILIYGITADSETVHVLSYDDGNVFNKIDLSSEVFQLAFDKLTSDIIQNAKWADSYRVALLSLEDNPPLTSFATISYIQNQLYDYFNSVDCEVSIRNEIKLGFAGYSSINFGISAFKSVIENLQTLSHNKGYIDYRHIHLLYEQKKSICKKLEYLVGEFHLDRSIYDEYEVIKNIVYKAMIIFRKGIVKEHGSGNLFGRLQDVEVVDKIVNCLNLALSYEMVFGKKINIEGLL